MEMLEAGRLITQTSRSEERVTDVGSGYGWITYTRSMFPTTLDYSILDGRAS